MRIVIKQTEIIIYHLDVHLLEEIFKFRQTFLIFFLTLK